MSDEGRRARAAQRGNLVGGLVSREDDLPPTADTAIDRLRLVAELSARAWALSGQPTPSYPREQMPGLVIRRG